VTAPCLSDATGYQRYQNYEEMATKLAEATGARSVTPAIYQTVLLSFAGQARGRGHQGIDPSAREKATKPCSVSSPGNWTSPQTRTALKLC